MEINRGRSVDATALLTDFHILETQIQYDKDYTLDLGGGVTRGRAALAMARPIRWATRLIAGGTGRSVLFSGDVVQNKTGPNFFICGACSPLKWLAVLDQIAQNLHPKIIVPDHSDIGDISLIAQERDLMQDLQSRSMALKAEGKSADEAGKIVADEFHAKHQGWGGMGNLDQAVHQAYGIPDPPTH